MIDLDLSGHDETFVTAPADAKLEKFKGVAKLRDVECVFGLEAKKSAIPTELRLRVRLHSWMVHAFNRWMRRQFFRLIQTALMHTPHPQRQGSEAS